MRDDPKAKRAIRGLLGHLQPSPADVDRWPDEENRASRDVDAVAGPYAIEHTCVDSFPGQSEDSAFFDAIAALEAELTLPYRLHVSVPVGALTRGTDWSDIVSRIRRWIVDASPDLPLAHSSVSIDGVPFTLDVWRYDASWQPRLILSRLDPGNAGFVEMLKNQATRKLAKLKRYKDEGRTTILLLESRCVALMSSDKMGTGFAEAFPVTNSIDVDQVWYADWSCESVPSYRRIR